MDKRFSEWMDLKRRIDENDPKPPFISEGDLWWCATGENVGVEINGKGAKFSRPVVVFKKFGRLGFFGIPVTTRSVTGSWYAAFRHKDVLENAVLTQGRFFSNKRVYEKLGALDDTDFKNIKEAFARLFR